LVKEEPPEKEKPSSTLVSENQVKPLHLIMETWRAFFENHLEDPSPLLLRFAKKSLVADTEIPASFSLTLENELDVKLFEEVKTEALEYLRRAHATQELQIITHIPKEEDKPKTPYTNSERFQAMLQESAALRSMTERFGLDPDF
jgi:hypothetical protein